MLTPDQTRALFESIDTSTLIGPRDRALIAVMAHTFARIGAVVAMRVADYRANGERWWVRLHEKATRGLERSHTVHVRISSIRVPMFNSGYLLDTSRLTRGTMGSLRSVKFQLGCSRSAVVVSSFRRTTGALTTQAARDEDLEPPAPAALAVRIAGLAGVVGCNVWA